MKKTLIGLAVVLASGAAFAQSGSGVSVYGVADVGLTKSSSDTDSDLRVSGNESGNNGNSRFGIKASEDLGGGLKASVNLEANVNLKTGATDTSLFQRAANVTIGSEMGELRIGRGLSLGHAAMASYDATGIANYSTVATTFGAIGGSRNDSEIRLTSKEIHPGLKLAVGYVFEADNKAAGDAKESKMDLAAMYANGPISASVVYSKPGKTEKSFALGGGYSFGQYKVMASYQDPAGMSKGFTVGGSADFGAATVAVDVARDTEAKATNLVVEGKYSLSKRTTTYAAYQRFGATSSNTVSAGLRHNF